MAGAMRRKEAIRGAAQPPREVERTDRPLDRESRGVRPGESELTVTALFFLKALLRSSGTGEGKDVSAEHHNALSC